MSPSTCIDHQRGWVREWLSLVLRRAADRARADGPLSERASQLRRQAQREIEILEKRYAEAEREDARALAQGLSRAEEGFERANRERLGIEQTVSRRLEEEQEAAERVLRRARDESRFEARALYEAKKADLATRVAQFEAESAALEEQLSARSDEMQWLLGRARREPIEASAAERSGDDARLAAADSLAAADKAMERLRRAIAIHDSGAWGAMAATTLAAAAAGSALVALVGLPLGTWVAGAVGGGLALGVGALAATRTYARRRAARDGAEVARALAESVAARRKWQATSRARHEAQRAQNKDDERRAYTQAEETYQARLAEQAERRRAALAELETESKSRLEESVRRREEEVARLRAENGERRRAAADQLEASRKQTRESFAAQEAAAETALAEFRAAAEARWSEGSARILAELGEFRRACDASFPPWADLADDDWRPERALSGGIRIGHWRLGPAEVLRLVNTPAARQGFDVATDDAARLSPADVADLPTLEFPIVLEWPLAASACFEGPQSASVSAIAALQAVVLRLLISSPPGRARFTLFDPVGLGRSFAAFMHLSDYEEALVGKRIWTDAADIESKLASLAEHVELITQQYLRNEFATLEDYNEQAGEVLEPYRYLVVADLPAGFTEVAGRRLLRILRGGARCGVYMLLAVDTDRTPPPGLTREELAGGGAHFRWSEGQWRWVGRGWEHLPVELDPPPEEKLLTRLLRQVGQAAVGADRVVVPFATTAPEADAWWSADSRAGLRVPLGPAGANKTQHLELGRGTAQHALVVGKTGSGKSTLLHALITGASLWYGPDQVELYLIDFKKGVEFKPYAAHQLPQARVIAIESDREFGLSVLEKLDAELRRRGEQFRAAGVQDLAGYRDTPLAASDPMPRTLLIVDEFQEFFVADDKLAHDAALLLDRLVRQGRAFGLHVVLGSQTLGGAYSLARSTLGQMAIRIMLPCSEADGHLALGDENTAARHLSRPGQAIYNDAGGAVEANRAFQVAWLDESSREEYLAKLALRAAGDVEREPAIVFEGNTPGDLAANDFLAGELALPPGHRGAELAIWLGEPVSIKSPTCAILRRQSGHNLLVVGQRDDVARSLSAAALVSLAAQYAAPAVESGARGPRVVLLDGSSVVEGSESLAEVARRLRLPIAAGSPRETTAMMAELAAELDRRQGSEAEAPPWLAIVFDLQRFRDLRRRDDDFGFGSRETAATPAQTLARIAREGPLVGIHVLVWCDNWNNLQRSFDRTLLREFDQRVLFQMSPNDSSCLIDSPTAASLGPHRALFHDDELGLLEKFRPYRWPSAGWLAERADQIAARPAPSWR